jgi:SAM-dependent methyltransferase
VNLRFSDETFVMLDPAVDVLDGEIDGCRLLCHGHFGRGMAVPPGEGLMAFVDALSRSPANVGTLRREFDDEALIDVMLSSLTQHGFAHVTSSVTPSLEELSQLRRSAVEKRNFSLRRLVHIDLDGASPLDRLDESIATGEIAPEILLCCRHLTDHRRTLAELAHRRQSGQLRAHQVVVRTADPTGDDGISRTLIRLAAPVHVEGIVWPPADERIPGLAELTRSCVPVHALMAPDLSILDRAVRARTIAWARAAFVSGLSLQIDPDALWPAVVADEAFVAVFDAVRALEDELGDVVIANLPSDEVLLGNAASDECPERMSRLARRFRMAYLKLRIPLLKLYEADNIWSQTPEAEDKLIKPQEDLLPTHPELLHVQPGSILVDVCGGAGRVARRLAPSVGPDGLVVSIEMLSCLSHRARQFAQERGVMNVQFRTGLAQRIPLPDGTVDAAVNEWTGAIWELGLGPAMVEEMARVVRRGGHLAVTHRLVQLSLSALASPWVQYEDIYERMRRAFDQPRLAVIAERVWGLMAPSLAGEHASQWRKQYVPPLVDPHDMVYEADEADPRADVFLTIIAQKQ